VRSRWFALPASRPDPGQSGSKSGLFYQLKTSHCLTGQYLAWAEVRRETGRGKDQFDIRDLFADERCSRPILDFLSTTDVGRLRKMLRVRCRSRNSGCGEKGKSGGGKRLRSWVPGTRSYRSSFPHPRGFMASAEEG